MRRNPARNPVAVGSTAASARLRLLAELREGREELGAVGARDGVLIEEADAHDAHRELDRRRVARVNELGEVRAKLGHVEHAGADERDDRIRREFALLVQQGGHCPQRGAT